MIHRVVVKAGCTRRHLLRKIVPGIPVLVYHRIAEPAHDPHLLAVSPRRFEEHLKFLSANYNPVRLEDLLRSNTKLHARSRAVAVTFDDGYLDNLVHAKPLLEKFDVPATVFVATCNVQLESRRRPVSFWWDALGDTLLHPGTLPAQLEIEINGSSVALSIKGSERYSEEEFRRNRGWTVHDKPPTNRHKLYLRLHRLMESLAPEEQQHVIGILRALTGRVEGQVTLSRGMTNEEVASLVEGGLVDVGAHTVNHPVLAARPLSEQVHEIQGSKRALESIVGKRIRGFAYPYGYAGAFNKNTLRIVRDCGFEFACTTFEGRLSFRTNLLQIPRLIVRNSDTSLLDRLPSG